MIIIAVNIIQRVINIRIRGIYGVALAMPGRTITGFYRKSDELI